MSERLRRLRVKYRCCTASSCCTLSDLADRALLKSCKAAATLQTCTCRVSMEPVALVTVMVNHILSHHLLQSKQIQVFSSDLAFHHIHLYLSKKPLQVTSIDPIVGRHRRVERVAAATRILQSTLKCNRTKKALYSVSQCHGIFR